MTSTYVQMLWLVDAKYFVVFCHTGNVWELVISKCLVVFLTCSAEVAGASGREEWWLTWGGSSRLSFQPTNGGKQITKLSTQTPATRVEKARQEISDAASSVLDTPALGTLGNRNFIQGVYRHFHWY
jgi:hypothetical protein